MAGARRMVVTGPECSGKTTLAKHLAGRFGVPLALEFARIYLETRGPEYDKHRLWVMSRLHQAYQNEQVGAEAAFAVFDTDLTNYKIWSEEVFGRCDPDLLRREEAEIGHVYLLCAPDLPWEFDPLRENPDDRDRLFRLHEAEIRRLGRRYEIVQGLGETRNQNAEAAWIRLMSL